VASEGASKGRNMSDIKQGEGSEILAERHEISVSNRDWRGLDDILVIEDNPVDSDRLRAILHFILGRSVTIRSAETLASALDEVLSNLPDVIFLDDYLKPNDCAADTIPYLRRAGYVGHIIVISGEVDRQRKLELLKLGATDAIHKDEVDSACVTAALGRVRDAQLKRS